MSESRKEIAMFDEGGQRFKSRRKGRNYKASRSVSFWSSTEAGLRVLESFEPKK